MKKAISIIAAALIMAGCLSACGSGNNQPAGVKDVLEQGMAEADNKEADNTQNQKNSENQEETASTTKDSTEDVDVDLTVLSSTMVYSEVYNMMSMPEEYIGKTVKMKGPFAFYHDEATDNYYFACIIKDATACCSQGIEFVLTDDYVYPDDYPEVDEEICVVGVFDTYKEGDYTYCTLRNAKLV